MSRPKVGAISSGTGRASERSVTQRVGPGNDCIKTRAIRSGHDARLWPCGASRYSTRAPRAARLSRRAGASGPKPSSKAASGLRATAVLHGREERGGSGRPVG